MQEQFGNALFTYAQSMRTYVSKKLEARYGAGQPWFEAFIGALSPDRQTNVLANFQAKKYTSPQEAIDVAHIGDVLLGQKDVFRPDFGKNFNSAVTWAREINDVRNDFAHQKPVQFDDAYRALDSMSRILTHIDDQEAVQKIKALRESLTSGTAAPAQAAPTASGTLKPWWQLAEPHRDIRNGQFDENTFAAKLDDVVAERAPEEYRRADLFFKKTYLTRELGKVLSDTLKKLAGSGGEAVVQLRTPFGGGKTHALIALYHLVKHYADIDPANLAEILKEASLKDVPRARVAVLVGTELSPNGRKVDGVTIQTLWGEVAYQLGGLKALQQIQTSDQSLIPPDKTELIALLKGIGPSLILIDELLVYQVKASAKMVGNSTLQAQTFAFLQSLSEAVAAVDGVALVTTFPESHIEYYDHRDAPEVFGRLEKIFGRVQAVRIPVQGEEIYEVIRRRLFETIQESEAKGVVAQYQDFYTQHKDEIPNEARTAEYARKMRLAFPFHPELIDVLYEEWGTIQSFQKTRGVLKLLARVIEHGYMSPAARPLISLGDVGLEDGQLRTNITSVLQNPRWDAVIASDVAGQASKAFQIDKERGDDYARFRLAQTVASAIFMNSHSGASHQGITRSNLTLSLIYPTGITPLLVTDALDRLKSRLYYLHTNGVWVFQSQPNLNAVLSDRMAQVKKEKALELVQENLQKVSGSGLFRPHVWPHSYKDVPDQTTYKLVLLSPDHTTDDQTGLNKAITLLQENSGSGPRQYKNTVVYLAGSSANFIRVTDAARTLLALQDIETDKGLVLSDEQKRELKERLQKAKEALPSQVKAAYTHLYEPTDAVSGERRVYDVSAQIKTKNTLQDAVLDTLKQEDRLLTAIDPALIVQGPWRLWPEDEKTLDLKNLRDYFYRFPNLPMLETVEAIRNAIVRGVQNGFFELGARKVGGDGYQKVWDSASPVTAPDVHFEAHYHLGRPGKLERPEGPKPDPTPNPGPTGGSTGGGKGPEPTGGTGPTPPVVDPKPRGKTRVQLRFPNFDVNKAHVLLDLEQALQDAKGKVTISLSITAENASGLDQTFLDLSVRELLSQYGLSPEWQED